jgi:DNA-directed RNA polymerase specialized sigma24 family protein
MHSDLDLMVAYRRGDRAALMKLVRRHHVTLYHFFRSLCRGDDIATELTVISFQHVAVDPTPPHRKQPFHLYLYRVGYDCWVRHLEHAARPLALPMHQPPGILQAPVLQASPAARKDGEALMDCLSPELKVLLVLKETAMLSYEEIGLVLDISPLVVGKRIRDAYRYLRAGTACRAALPGPVVGESLPPSP